MCNSRDRILKSQARGREARGRTVAPGAAVSLFHSREAGRRGIIAITALVMLSVLVVVALAASEEMVLEAKAAQNRNAIRQAYLCAYTGIDYCLYLSGVYSDWRTRLGSGDWIANHAVGGGTVTVSASDPDDGVVAGDPIGVVQLTASATKDLAKRTLTTLAQPPPGMALKYALCSLSNTDLQLRGGVHVYGDIRTTGKVRADADVSLAGNIYTAPGQDVDAVLEDADTQVIRTGLAVDAPPVDFAWYRSVAREIFLPVEAKHYALRNARLTPTNNPFGLAHPQGLYFVDAGGKEVRIYDSYLIGSLIITNSPRLKIRGGYYHKTYLKQYPALLCSGDIFIEINQNLQESVVGVDFNGDADMKDLFVSQIHGVVYSSGMITGLQYGVDPGPFYFRGAMVASRLIIAGSAFHVSYDPELAETPVAGFQGPGLVLLEGSMQD